MRTRAPGAGLQGHGGFTLIEMLVVLLLVSILVGVAAPMLLEPPGRTADDFQSSLRPFREARRLALRRGRPVRLVLYPRQGRYSIQDDAVPDPPGSGAPVPRDSSGRGRPPLDVGRLAGDVARDPPEILAPLVFHFMPGGRAAGPALRLVAPGGRRFQVRVDPWTGKADARPSR